MLEVEQLNNIEIKKPTLDEFIAFQAALRFINQNAPPGSDAQFFSQEPTVFRRAQESFLQGKTVSKEEAETYLTDVPKPIGLTEISEEKFAQLASDFGPDIMRAGFGCDNVTAGERMPLPVGGACLIETFGLQLLANSKALKEDPELIPQVAESLIANAPYYTQTTGTLLSGGDQGVGIMYLEVFPWFIKAEGFGVTEAKAKTVAAYERMYQANKRRAELINPDFKLLGIQFEDLNLEADGQLERWFEQSKNALPSQFQSFANKPFDPNGFLAAWVRYTYNGPEILDLVKQEAWRTYGISLDQFDTHVRTKQKDHFHNPTMLFTSGTSIREQEFLSKYPNIANLAIDAFQLKQRVSSNGYIGFDDLMMNGEIVHKTVLLGSDKKKPPETWEEVQDVLTSPLRLHQGNVEEHIELLQVAAWSGKAEFIRARTLLKKAQSLEGITVGLAKQKQEQKNLQMLAQSLSEQSGKNVPEELTACFQEEILKTKVVQSVARQSSLSPEDVAGQFMAATFIGDSMTIAPALQTELRQKVAEHLDKRLKGIEVSIAKVEQTCQQMKEVFEAELLSVGPEVASLAKQLCAVPECEVLPLWKNLVVSHAVQLSFDPDMREFIFDAVAVAQSSLSDSEKGEVLSQAMQQILPKMAQYLLFIMKGGSYPQSRFVTTYKPLRSMDTTL